MENKGKDKSGWVYVMRSEDMPINRYKIGMTKNSPDKRALQLSTSHESNMIVLMKKKVSDRFKAEKKVFELLDENRVSKKELIEIFSFDVLVSVFNYVEDLYPVSEDKGFRMKITMPRKEK